AGEFRLGFGPASLGCQAFRPGAYGEVGERIQSVVVGEIGDGCASRPWPDTGHSLDLGDQSRRVEFDPFRAEFEVCLRGSLQRAAFERHTQLRELLVRKRKNGVRRWEQVRYARGR